LEIYRKFYEVALPLTQLTRKGQAYVWIVHCEESFQKLKMRPTTSFVNLGKDKKDCKKDYNDAPYKELRLS
jgi:hypothetical protein